MYDEKIEALISAALADGVLTEKEKQVLFKRAQAEGIDLDEFEMVLDARLVELEKAEKEKAEKSAPKSTKYGDVRKCPVCGAMVPALAGVCPECGYEFSGVDANLSSQKLAEQLIALEKECEEEKKKEYKDVNYRNRDYEKAQIDAKYKNTIVPQRKRTLIETFPIPNTKSDLFEFITALLPKIGDRQLGKAYRAKVEECILKANTLFPNDSTFAKITTQAQGDIKKHKQRKLIIIMCIVCVVIFGIGIPVIWGVTHSEAYTKKKINEYISAGYPEKAIKYCTRNYKGNYNDQGDVSRALAQVGNIDEAIKLYSIQHTKGGGSPNELREALIRVKRYDEALDWSNQDYTYCTTMLWILEDFCKDGKKQDAHAFLKSHPVNNLGKYDKLRERYTSNDLDHELRKYIDNY